MSSLTSFMSSTSKVCENLKVFGLAGFKEVSSAGRFAAQKEKYFESRKMVHWIQTGKWLRLRKKSESQPQKSQKPQPQPQKARKQQVKISKALAMELLSL